jgi:hypothetical protein
MAPTNKARIPYAIILFCVILLDIVPRMVLACDMVESISATLSLLCRIDSLCLCKSDKIDTPSSCDYDNDIRGVLMHIHDDDTEDRGVYLSRERERERWPIYRSFYFYLVNTPPLLHSFQNRF